MAHLLRGKQAGIQGDFSAGIGPECFNVDDVSSSLTTKALAHSRLRDKSIRHKFASISSSLRSSTVTSGYWHQRIQVWCWSNLHIWPKESQRHIRPTTKRFSQELAVLCRQTSLPRRQKWDYCLFFGDQKGSLLIFATRQRFRYVLRCFHWLRYSGHAKWRYSCFRYGSWTYGALQTAQLLERIWSKSKGQPNHVSCFSSKRYWNSSHRICW